LNYTSNIGSPQQSLNTTDATALTKTSGSTKTGTSLALVLGTANDGTSGAGALDRASLSVNSVLLEHVLSGSDVRADKIAGLQPLIAAGTYNVSSSDVADKLLSALLQ
jgi:anti-sigma28 factor (negative regulator of flagellin synthesis)